jgi:5'-deoxynucleotidase YfbR-like HD superfamily hydrolase
MGFNPGFKGLTSKNKLACIVCAVDKASLLLQATKEWGSVWYTIHDSIHNSISQEMEKKHRIIEKEIKNLVNERINKPVNNINFYPRVINKTYITFSNNKLALLNKCLK